MSYQALARRWRPKTFAEMVGQDHIVRALSNALDSDRLHHAFLFTGTRGVGKTTIARILAKSLNCENGISSSPCGECGTCCEINEGRFLDLIEVDAASKTGVDDTRELLDNVPYAPVKGKFKVYLIDEVHMFSNHSFNALLKTLEEPPPHVKFLLATTDPQKVPMTVLSRCLQFSLNRLSIRQIQTQLQLILDTENIKYSQGALNTIAIAADGSMRDGLSILDQAIAFGGKEIKAEEVRRMLGVNSSEKLIDILKHIHFGDADKLLREIDSISQRSPDFSMLLKDLLFLIHRISLLQATKLAWQENWGDRVKYDELCSLISSESAQLYYQIGLLGQRDLPYAPDFQSGFEMTLLRMLAFRPGELIVRENIVKNKPISKKPGPSKSPNKTDRSDKNQIKEKKTIDLTSNHKEDLKNWHEAIKKLNLSGIAQQLADNCMVKDITNDKICLKVDKNCNSMIDSVASDRLREAICEYLGEKIDVEFKSEPVLDTPSKKKKEMEVDKQKKAEIEIATDPLILAMQDEFDAEVIDETIRPLDAK